MKRLQFFLTISLLFSFSTIISANEINQVTNIIKKLDSRFSEIASAKKVGTMGLDSMDSFFRSIIKKIPAVQSLKRINSNGLIINEISSQETDSHVKSVSDQKWFTQVKSTRLPYYGLNRDSSGTTSFFWSWPLISDDTTFNGVISAKISPSGILKMSSIKDSVPFAIIFNNSPVYKHRVNESTVLIDDTVSLSKHTKIILQSGNVKDDNSDANSAINEVINNDSVPDSSTMSAQETLQDSQPTNEHKQQQPLTTPQVYKSDALETDPPKDNKISTISIICSAGALCIIFIFIIARKRKKPDVNRFNIEKAVNELPLADELSAPVKISSTKTIVPKPVVMKQETAPVINDTDTKTDSAEIVTNNDETDLNSDDIMNTFSSEKATPANKEVWEERMRKELYREIHKQIMQWVVCESARLSGRIEELNKRLALSEKNNSPEIDSIKMEAQEISKEIELFRTHLTKNEQ